MRDRTKVWLKLARVLLLAIALSTALTGTNVHAGTFSPSPLRYRYGIAPIFHVHALRAENRSDRPLAWACLAGHSYGMHGRLRPHDWSWFLAPTWANKWNTQCWAFPATYQPEGERGR
jgi:hypothetical protein